MESAIKLENFYVDVEQELYIKEEVVISDMSDFIEIEVSDDDNDTPQKQNDLFGMLNKSNNELLTEENIKASPTTEQNDCTKCGKRLKDKYNLQKHMRLCSVDPFLKCEFCDHETKFTSNLRRHVQRMHENLKTKKIEKTSGRAILCEGNIKTKHTPERNQCAKCGVRFKYWSFLQRHQPVCRLAPFLKCDFCDYKTRHSYSLKTHLVRRHTNLKAKEILKIFDNARTKELKMFSKTSRYTSKFNRKNLAKEENIQAKNTTEQYECTKCGAKFERTRNLNRHLRLCGLTPFLTCNFCDFRTTYLRSMKMHFTRMHKDVKTEEIEKNLDEAKKKQKKMLGSRVMNTNYTTELDWNNLVKLYCSKCDMNFELISWKEQKCPQCCELALLRCLACEERYSNRSSMYYHLRSRCGPKEYFQCADCDYQTALKSHLMNHIAGKHMPVAAEEYQKCSKCGKSFKQRSYRRKHEKQCGKYLQCKSCPFRSKRDDYFRKHMQNHTMHLANGDALVNADFMDGTTNDEITDNIKTKAENEQSKCIKCGGWFKGRCNFRRHQKICGLPPFLKCEFCDYKTKQTSGLKLHLTKMHKDLKTGEIQKNIDTARTIEHKKFGIEAKPRSSFNLRNLAELYCSKCEINFKGKNAKDRECPQCCELAVFQCLKCDKRYAIRSSMYNHLTNTCWPREYFQCADCNYRTIIKTKLMLHIQKVHMTKAPEGYNKCGTCGKCKKQCSKEPDLPCELCLFKGKLKGKSKKRARNRRMHLDNEDVMVDVGFIKGITDAVEILENDLMDFQQESYVKEEVMISDMSDLSENEASNKNNMLQKHNVFLVNRKKSNVQILPHANTKTNGTSEQIECTKCGVKYKMGYRLQRHQKLCGLVPIVQCEFCDYKTIGFSGNLRKHFKRKHTDLEEETIQKILHTAKTREKEILKYEVSNHNIEKEHTTVRYECSTCASRFKYMYHLQQHKKKCGLAPFLNCNFCNYTTKCRNNLKRHLQTIHKDIEAEEIQKNLDRAKAKEQKMFGVPGSINAYCSKCKIRTAVIGGEIICGGCCANQPTVESTATSDNVSYKVIFASTLSANIASTS